MDSTDNYLRENISRIITEYSSLVPNESNSLGYAGVDVKSSPKYMVKLSLFENSNRTIYNRL